MASRLVRPDTAFSISSRRMKRVPIRSESHLAFIRQLPCLITGSYERVEAAHISAPCLAYGHTGRGMGRKADDVWVVPLSAEQHALQHHMGNEEEFWALAQINPYRAAAALYIASGDRETAILIIQHARDE